MVLSQREEPTAGAVSNRLENIEQLVRELSSEVTLLRREDLALEVSTLYPDLRSDSEIQFADKVRCFEIRLIGRALDLTGGNQKLAARLLGLLPSTLNEKMKRYKLLRASELKPTEQRQL